MSQWLRVHTDWLQLSPRFEQIVRSANLGESRATRKLFHLPGKSDKSNWDTRSHFSNILTVRVKL